MLAPGSTVGGKYRLVAQIGEGGMGVVWKATHEHLGHDIAVKFLTHVAATSETLVARFLDEARTAASVRHRNVVQLLDFGISDDSRPYMVMEFLEGESLADRIERQPPLSIVEVTQTIALTLSGLGAVHDRGIIHRDLKPENVFLTYDADGFFPKILDFGVSKDLGRDDAGNRGVRTRDGVLLGTPQYMSPEQARGLRDIDRRTDVYSMGVILYECLSGHRPFDSENVGDILMQVMSGKCRPLQELRPGLPTPLVEVVSKAMALDRDQRYPDAREMRNALFAAAATARPAAFGITDPSGALNAELASAVVRALQGQAPNEQSGLISIDGVPLMVVRPPPPTPAPASGMVHLPPSGSIPISTPMPGRAPTPLVPQTIPELGPPTTQSGSSILQPITPLPVKHVATSFDETTQFVPESARAAPAPQGRRWSGLVFGLLVLLTLGAGALIEWKAPGLLAVSARGTLHRLRAAMQAFGSPSGGGASVDAGVSDAGLDADVIHVRFRQVPDDAVITVDGHTYSPAEWEPLRSLDGGVLTIDIPRRRELYDFRVEAPGFMPFEGRRYATSNVLYRLRLRPLEDGGVLDEEDAGFDAGTVAPEEEERRPARRRPARRRHR